MDNFFPKTLMLSRSAPPTPTGSAIITGNLVRQFRRDEITVLGGKTMGAPPMDWQEDWPTIRYVTFMPPFSWRGAKYIRWVQWPWLFACVLWTLIWGRFGALLVVFSDDVYLLAGYLASVITRKPLFVYFHDVYLDSESQSRLAYWLEPRVFERAKHIFVMSEGLQDLYRPRYSEQTITPLLHSFNETLPQTMSVPPVGNPLRLVLSGNVNPSNWSASGRFAELVREREDVVLHVYTGTAQRVLARAGFGGDNMMVDSVSRAVLLQKLGEADVVLLPHGFGGRIADDDIQTVFPTRTIEYLICGRPILAHVPAGCFLATFLQKHDCALVVTEPSVEALNIALDRLQEDSALRQRLVENALKTAEMFQASRVAGHLREVLCQV